MITERTVRKTVDALLGTVRKNPEAAMEKLIPIASFFTKNESHKKQLELFKRSIDDKDNYYRLVSNLFSGLAPNCLEKLAENLVINAAWLGNQRVRKNRDAYDLNIPWAILMDPTTACNLHCTGCWAAGYGRTDNLGYELMDRIIREGVELGIYMYIFSGGEPLVKKDELIRLAEAHQDCYFLSFTNGTLIDERFAAELRRVGNFALAISMEGSEEETDLRRGKGSYDRMVAAMALLKREGVPFGFSSCYHSGNWRTVGSDAYIDWMIGQGALFGWYFTYIPVGAGAEIDLMARPEQREYLYHRVREMRKTKPIFLMDFWNDGEYVYGCIAGGRNYFHINARGDVEPCAFIHYSDTNIRNVSLLDALRSPLFQSYRKRQPFNKNQLRPCPLLDNPEALRAIVRESGAKSTEYTAPEDVESLTGKTETAAARWAPTAAVLWEENPRHEMLEKKEWPGKPHPEKVRRAVAKATKSEKALT